MFRHGDHTHREADVARLCAMGLTWPCTWMIRVATEDEPAIVDCGAAGWETPRGWECEAGHEHVDMETRARERWDYAHDGIEAGYLAKQGVGAVAMDGSGIEPVFV